MFMILLTLLILLLILTTNIILCNVINDIDTNTTINDNELDIKRKHYHKSRTYDIVIAHCKKDMNWIIELMNLCNDYKLRIFIYSKCGNIEKLNNLKLEKGNSCLKIISLDNYGREAYVYLWHIIYHYDRLPTMTFFMQDDTKEKENFNIISELINVLNSRNGFYSLSHTINPMGTFDADTLKRIFLADWADPFFYQRIIKGQQLWYTNWRATFGVSSTRINHLPIEAYKAAITVSNCSGSGYNLCHDDYFEVMWGAMFNCYLGPDGLISGSAASVSDFPQRKTTTSIYNCPNKDDNKTLETPLQVSTYYLAGLTSHQSYHYPKRTSFELGQYGEDCDGNFIRCYDFY